MAIKKDCDFYKLFFLIWTQESHMFKDDFIPEIENSLQRDQLQWIHMIPKYRNLTPKEYAELWSELQETSALLTEWMELGAEEPVAAAQIKDMAKCKNKVPALKPNVKYVYRARPLSLKEFKDVVWKEESGDFFAGRLVYKPRNDVQSWSSDYDVAWNQFGFGGQSSANVHALYRLAADLDYNLQVSEQQAKTVHDYIERQNASFKDVLDGKVVEDGINDASVRWLWPKLVDLFEEFDKTRRSARIPSLLEYSGNDLLFRDDTFGKGMVRFSDEKEIVRIGKQAMTKVFIKKNHYWFLETYLMLKENM